jgi:hypothetical protein
MGSIEGRTLPNDYPKPDEKHTQSLRKHIGNDLHRVMHAYSGSDKPGAGDGGRTRDFLLGKEMLYH